MDNLRNYPLKTRRHERHTEPIIKLVICDVEQNVEINSRYENCPKIGECVVTLFCSQFMQVLFLDLLWQLFIDE